MKIHLPHKFLMELPTRLANVNPANIVESSSRFFSFIGPACSPLLRLLRKTHRVATPITIAPQIVNYNSGAKADNTSIKDGKYAHQPH